jgi:hypothetical protein
MRAIPAAHSSIYCSMTVICVKVFSSKGTLQLTSAFPNATDPNFAPVYIEFRSLAMLILRAITILLFPYDGNDGRILKRRIIASTNRFIFSFLALSFFIE